MKPTLSTPGSQDFSWEGLFQLSSIHSCHWVTHSHPKGSYDNARFYLRRVLRRVVGILRSEEGFAEGFLEGVLQWVSKVERVLRRVLRRGSLKEGYQKVLRTPCWRVRPSGRVLYVNLQPEVP